jgi:hypothetical protein
MSILAEILVAKLLQLCSGLIYHKWNSKKEVMRYDSTTKSSIHKIFNIGISFLH